MYKKKGVGERGWGVRERDGQLCIETELGGKEEGGGKEDERDRQKWERERVNES